MITLFDYLPSQNAWKVRQLLQHLEISYRTEIIGIFEGHGQREDYLAINPWGAVPAIRLEDGSVLSESNAILWYLSTNTVYRSTNPLADAKILQWLSFEADYVQSSIGSLRFWTLTGKLSARDPAQVEGRRAVAYRALRVLNTELAQRDFIAGDSYSIADISIFAYAHLASDAGISAAGLLAFQSWIARVKAQNGFLAQMYPYSIDSHSSAELP
jgi:glutathione S-transferase